MSEIEATQVYASQEPEQAIPEAGKAIEGRSPGKIAWDRLRRDKVAMISGFVVLFFILVAIFAGLILKLYGKDAYTVYGGLDNGLLSEFGLPTGDLGGVSAQHWFGIEPLIGRDLFARLVMGTRTSVGIAFAVTAITSVIGVVLGLIAGFKGGKTDSLISRVTDLFLSFPGLIFLIAARPVLDNWWSGDKVPPTWFTISTVIIMLSVFGWTYTARLVRGQVLALREREFVEAARALGASNRHIIFKQILPNTWAPILIAISLAVPSYIAAEASLSFLGVGVPEPVPDWGRMIFDSIPYYSSDFFYFLLPSLFLFVLVLTFNLFGDGVRDALDPRSTR
jgi:peptide/nickel transport system permease protein